MAQTGDLGCRQQTHAPRRCNMNNLRNNCGWNVHWLLIAAGAPIALVGGILTASIVGAVVGIPMLLVAWSLLSNPVAPAACA
jgi:hypothetical protein